MLVWLLLTALVLLALLWRRRETVCSTSFSPQSFGLCMDFLELVDPQLKFEVVSRYSEIKEKPERLAALMKHIDAA